MVKFIMNKILKQGIINKINSFKMQLIINKNLYSSTIITKEIYETVENKLLEKIHVLYNNLEISI